MIYSSGMCIGVECLGAIVSFMQRTAVQSIVSFMFLLACLQQVLCSDASAFSRHIHCAGFFCQEAVGRDRGFKRAG